MSHIEILPATLDHARALAPRMRQADIDEVWATARHSPMAALKRSLEASALAWTGLVDGAPACLFGVGAPFLLSGVGAPWLLGSDDLLAHQKAFLRRNRAYLGRMLALYPRLENWVDCRNAASIRWLRWLGFRLAPAAPFGALGLPFHRFELRREPALMTYQTERLDDWRVEAEPLLARHWREIALDQDVVPLDPDWPAYAQIEAAGMLHITTARLEGALVGYVVYFLAPNLHYRSLKVAEADVFWLAPECRKGTAGIRLLKAAERNLKPLGVNKIVNKVKLHFDAGPVFERLGYTAIERVYAKTMVD